MVFIGVELSFGNIMSVVLVSFVGVCAVVLDSNAAVLTDSLSAASIQLNIDFALCVFLSFTFMAVLTSVDVIESVVTLD